VNPTFAHLYAPLRLCYNLLLLNPPPRAPVFEMADPLLLLLGAAFILSSAFLFFFKQDRRNVLLDRMHLRRRRTSGSGTPPRSLSPGKKQPLSSSSSDFSDTFPPSRRSVLSEIPGLPSKLGKSGDALAASPPDSRSKCLPLATSYLEVKEPLYTPCEFSTDEIKALGDFPDYEKLSGVPLPRPYHEFDIKKARPRPYRPFRWNYHQTMCTLTSSTKVCSTY
jgi:hypothetical protein